MKLPVVVLNADRFWRGDLSASHYLALVADPETHRALLVARDPVATEDASV